MNIICLPCTIVVGKFKEHALAMEKKNLNKKSFLFTNAFKVLFVN